MAEQQAFNLLIRVRFPTLPPFFVRYARLAKLVSAAVLSTAVPRDMRVRVPHRAPILNPEANHFRIFCVRLKLKVALT